uniref:Uncharacterized protein n=2 Tax=Trichobilharzia regenti TaxID=157069 RepID=A0AA85JQR1_TRIRE|nr:unnamed protein product [Trichobilharzia regenti]
MNYAGRKPMKPLNQLKNIHNEHYAKLQNKHATETDLLDDLRMYCKQRAVIEREYGQSLQKLVNSFLSKKEFLSSTSSKNDMLLSSKQPTVWHIWHSLLTESNSLALSRLRASDNQQRLSNELKPLKSQRLSVNKRVFEQLKILQGDLAACVQEMVKSHKVYAEEEKQAQETRLKTLAAREKIQRRSTDIFHSMAQLHKNYDKLLGKRQAFDARSATAKNEYLFQLTAINAHLKHYFSEDLPVLAKTLDGELYEKMGEAFTTLCENEIEFCTNTQKRFDALLKEASHINRINAWEDFLKSSPHFDKPVQYHFEPMKGDETTVLYSGNIKESNLEQIARKLSRRLVVRERRIKSYENELKMLQAGYVSSLSGIVTPHQQSQSHQMQQNSSETENNEELLAFNQEYVEHKVEELQFAIRREEIERVKIEACLSLLRNSSIEVNDFIVEARIAAEAAAAAAAQFRNENSSSGILNDSTPNRRPNIRPSGEGSSDSAASSSGVNQFIDHDSRLLGDWDRPTRPYGSGIIGRDSAYPIHRSFNDDDGDDDTTGQFYRSRINDWSSTFPRPTTLGQVNNSSEKGYHSTYKSPLQTNTKITYPNHINSSNIDSIGSIKHDYQNVNHMNPRTRDDIAVHRSVNNSNNFHNGQNYNTTANNNSNNHASILRVASSDNFTDNKDDVDFEAVWSENGRLRRANVVHEFRAKKPNELDLVVHETVVLLEDEHKNGWIKVRSLIDGNEGLVPFSYLKLCNPHVSNEDHKVYKDNNNNNNFMQLNNENEKKSSNSVVLPENTDHNYLNKTNQLDLVNTSLPPEIDAPRLSCTSELLVNESTSNLITKPPLSGSFVKTLIDFHGTNIDELSFKAGAIIRVIGRAPNINDLVNASSPSSFTTTTKRDQLASMSNSGVDDGWWEGDLLLPAAVEEKGKQKYYSQRGVFPSMLVQPLSSTDSALWSVRWDDISPIPTGYSIEANQNVQRTHTIPDCHHDDVKKDKKCKYTDEEDYIRLYAKELPASSSSRVNKVNSEGFCLSENVEPPVSLSSPEAKPSLSNNIATNRQSHHNNHCTHHRHKHCKADEKIPIAEV